MCIVYHDMLALQIQRLSLTCCQGQQVVKICWRQVLRTPAAWFLCYPKDTRISLEVNELCVSWEIKSYAGFVWALNGNSCIPVERTLHFHECHRNPQDWWTRFSVSENSPWWGKRGITLDEQTGSIKTTTTKTQMIPFWKTSVIWKKLHGYFWPTLIHWYSHSAHFGGTMPPILMAPLSWPLPSHCLNWNEVQDFIDIWSCPKHL